MAFASKTLTAMAFLGVLPLGACATAPAPAPAGGYGGADAQAYQRAPDYGPHYGPEYGDGAVVAPVRLTSLEAHDGLLSSPPNNARPGDCYAKVVVPGQPIGAPPPQPRAVWVQTPPGPGQISPTWCIYYLPGAPQPVVMTPERYGWIRVVCDKDATEDKIRHVQRRLHEWGDYDGAYDGRFDGPTAQGVTRFQEQRHIDHGGYLSVRTVEELDGAPPQAVLTPAFDAGRPNPNAPILAPIANVAPAGAIYASPVYQMRPAPQTYQGVYPPTYTQPAYPQPTYASPCPTTCVSAAPPVVYAPPPPPQIITQRQIVVQRVIQPVYIQTPAPAPQVVYAPPPPPQVIYQPSPPQIVVQKVVQPVYQPIYAGVPQGPCGQPACMPQPQPYPCGGPVCANPGGQGWGPVYGQQGPGAPPYRALLTWPGKSSY